MTSRTQTNSATWLASIACIVLFAGCHSESLTSSAPAADGWRTVAPPNGSFSFSVPGEPQKQVEEIHTELGPATNTYYSLTQGKAKFFVASTEYPEGKLTPSGADNFLHEAIEELRKVPGTIFLSEKKMDLNGSSGRDVVVNVTKKNPVRMHQRWYIFKNRIIALSAEYPQAEDDSKEATRFMDSLKVN